MYVLICVLICISFGVSWGADSVSVNQSLTYILNFECKATCCHPANSVSFYMRWCSFLSSAWLTHPAHPSIVGYLKNGALLTRCFRPPILCRIINKIFHLSDSACFSVVPLSAQQLKDFQSKSSNIINLFKIFLKFSLERSWMNSDI